MSLELTIGSDVSGLISGVNAANDRIQQLETRIANLQRIAGNTTDFNKLNQAINLIKQNQIELTRIQTTAIPNFGKMATSANELEKRIRVATSAEHEFNAILGATPALLAGAENPAQALGHEFLILATGIQRAKEAGQTFGQISTTLLGSIFSLQGAITLGTALLFGFGKEIFGSGEKADKSAQQLEELLKPIEDISRAVRANAEASSEGDIAKVQALADVVQDQTKSYKERNDALLQLKDINKSYFGDLDLETSKLATLNSKVEEYTNAIIASAVVEGFKKRIGEVNQALNDETEKLRKVAIAKSLYDQQLKNVDESARRAGASTLEYEKQLEVVTELKGQLNKLKDEIKGAVDESVKFKPLVEPHIDKPKIKKEDLDFIPRDVNAKLFVDTDLVPVVDVPKFKSDLEKNIPEIDDFHLKLGIALDAQTGAEKDIDAIKKKIQEATSFNKIIDLNLQLNQLDPFEGITKNAAIAAKTVDGILTPAFQGLFQAIEQGQPPLKALFKSLEAAVIQLIAELVKAVIESKILKAVGAVVPGGGFLSLLGLTGFAEGGEVSGPGGPRSDSIPAMLSNGEYVMNASAVSKYGSGFMSMINSKRFADGGLVSNFGGSSAADLISTNRIRSTIQASAKDNSGININGEFEIAGENLQLVLDRYSKRKGRSY